MTSTTELPTAEAEHSDHGTSQTPKPTPEPTPLRANRGLHGIYAGSFTAFLGIAMAEVVYPLLVLGFTGKPLLAGLFGTIQFAALVLASVPAGNFVDRHDRRRVLITSETIRAALATVLAVTLASGHVWLVEVYLIAAVLGVCQPLSSVRVLALRSLAEPSQLAKVLSIEQVVGGVAQLIGPAIGTVLYTVDRSLPFVAIAAGFGVSALCATAVRFDGRPEPAAESASGEPESPFTGLRIIWSHAVMRSTMLFIMLLNLVGVSLDLALIVQARHEGVPTHSIGLIFAALAAGGVLGAPCVPKLNTLLPPGQVLVGFGLIVTLSFLMIGLFPLGGLWIAGWLAAIGFTMPAAEVLVDILILQQVPDHQRGRALSAVMTFLGLGLPLGAAIGGSLLQVLSPAAVLLGAAAAFAGVTVFAFSQRALRTAEWPS